MAYLLGRGGEQHVIRGLDDVVLRVRVFSIRLVGENLHRRKPAHDATRREIPTIVSMSRR